jgi:serine/threonine protein kinase
MGPEALRSNVFNSASDVWSYGVFMWELFTCGQQPYLEIPFEEMATALAAGTRLGQPYNCPDELYSIMYSTWHQV